MARRSSRSAAVNPHSDAQVWRLQIRDSGKSLVFKIFPEFDVGATREETMETALDWLDHQAEPAFNKKFLAAVTSRGLTLAGSWRW